MALPYFIAVFLFSFLAAGVLFIPWGVHHFWWERNREAATPRPAAGGVIAFVVVFLVGYVAVLLYIYFTHLLRYTILEKETGELTRETSVLVFASTVSHQFSDGKTGFERLEDATTPVIINDSSHTLKLSQLRYSYSDKFTPAVATVSILPHSIYHTDHDIDFFGSVGIPQGVRDEHNNGMAERYILEYISNDEKDAVNAPFFGPAFMGVVVALGVFVFSINLAGGVPRASEEES